MPSQRIAAATTAAACSAANRRCRAASSRCRWAVSLASERTACQVGRGDRGRHVVHQVGARPPRRLSRPALFFQAVESSGDPVVVPLRRLSCPVGAVEPSW